MNVELTGSQCVTTPIDVDFDEGESIDTPQQVKNLELK